MGEEKVRTHTRKLSDGVTETLQVDTKKGQVKSKVSNCTLKFAKKQAEDDVRALGGSNRSDLVLYCTELLNIMETKKLQETNFVLLHDSKGKTSLKVGKEREKTLGQNIEAVKEYVNEMCEAARDDDKWKEKLQELG